MTIKKRTVLGVLALALFGLNPSRHALATVGADQQNERGGVFLRGQTITRKWGGKPASALENRSRRWQRLRSAGYNQLEECVWRVWVRRSLGAPPPWPSGTELLNHFFSENVPRFRRGHNATPPPENKVKVENGEVCQERYPRIFHAFGYELLFLHRQSKC